MQHLDLTIFISVCTIIIITVLIRWLHVRSMRIRNQLQMNFIFNNITHELLTPLTIISASVEKLREEHPDSRRDLELMDLNIQRSVRLLQQILETSKIQAGGLKILVSQGDVMQYIKETARSLEPLMVRKHLTFTINCKPESMMGWLDTDKMDKIIFNLLSNATKYTPEGGSVSLDIATNDRYDHIIIQVKDTGVGIPNDKMKHLYTRFYDGDYRNNLTFGTGLGLALTHDLTFSMGGRIVCESAEGQGTTFTLEIPINKESFTPAQIDEQHQIHIPEKSIADLPQAENLTEDTVPTAHANASRVLIVEDNIELLRLMRRLLQPRYNVLTANNGREALQQIQTNKVDIVVSDVMMPEMDGYELTDHIKHNEMYSHLPIILLTAKTTEDDQQKALLMGADGYITKPFKIRDLQLRIDNLITNRQRIYTETPAVAEEPADTMNADDRAFLDRAAQCVHKHISDSDYDREAFARDMGTSVSTLYNKLRELTGKSMSNYIRDIRIQEACKIAKNESNTRVSDIAYRVGFRDAKYFATAFKRITGKQPKEYFAELREEKN
jgi:CheY-like chemotaxis protein